MDTRFKDAWKLIKMGFCLAGQSVLNVILSHKALSLLLISTVINVFLLRSFIMARAERDYAQQCCYEQECRADSLEVLMIPQSHR